MAVASRLLRRLWIAKNEKKERAIKLAKQARDIFKKTPKAFKKELEEVNAWLEKHDKDKSLSLAKQ